MQQPQQQQQLPQQQLPPHPRESQFVQKLQGDQIQTDVTNLNRYEVDTPYANLEQAVLALLPFHVRSAQQPRGASCLCRAGSPLPNSMHPHHAC